MDGDGHADLLIGALWADGIGNGETNAGETYLIAAADLVALDKADGTEDGVIDLANVQNGAASYRFVGADRMTIPAIRSLPPVMWMGMARLIC